jgi:hypothetical protein
MRAIQSAFSRLKDTLRYESKGDNENIEDKVERKLILKLMVLLYNHKLEKVGFNQIWNVYAPEWSVDANFLDLI